MPELPITTTRGLTSPTSSADGCFCRHCVTGLFRGVRFRLLWNGILLGVVLGVQRSYYAPARMFFLDAIDAAASAVGAASIIDAIDILRYGSG